MQKKNVIYSQHKHVTDSFILKLVETVNMIKLVVPVIFLFCCVTCCESSGTNYTIKMESGEDVACCSFFCSRGGTCKICCPLGKQAYCECRYGVDAQCSCK